MSATNSTPPGSTGSIREGYRPSPITDPRRTFAAGRWTLILTRELGHPVERVWAALTEPGQLRQWAPFVPDRDLADIGDVVMTMIGGDEANWEAGGAGPAGQAGQAAETEQGAVLEVDAPRLLVYRWGEDVLRWDLAPTEGGSTVQLRHTLADEGFTSAVAAGWHLCFDVVDALLKGAPFGPVVGSRAKEYGWDDLNLRYAEILGVRASFT